MMERFRVFVANKWLRYGLIALGGLFVLTLVFGAGFVAGRWSASPFRALPLTARRDLTFKSGHGAIGMIRAIEGQKITIQSRDGKLETVLVSNDTQFDKNFKKISYSDLKINDPIVVIGSPNEDGEIDARLVGLIDPTTIRFPSRNFLSPGVSK